MHWQREAHLILKTKARLRTVRAVAFELGLSIGKVSEFCRLGRALEVHPELSHIKNATQALRKLEEIETKLHESFKERTFGDIRSRRR